MPEEPRYTEAQNGPGVMTEKVIDALWGPSVAAENARRYRDHMRIPDVLQSVNDAPPQPTYCYYCHQLIRIMINRGTGWCSEQCRKALADE